MPLFGRRDKHDKHKDNAPTAVSPPADSGYATSENPSSEVTATTANMGDHGLNSNTSNNETSRSRPTNLQVDRPTGNVIDRDTGNAVVTVTTTTTTTTTTTSNRDGNIEVKTEPANEAVQHRYDELQRNPNRNSNLTDITNNSSNQTGNAPDYNTPSRTSNYLDTTTTFQHQNVPDTSGNRNDANVTSATINPSHESANFATTDPNAPGNFRQGSPAIPAKSAKRESSRNRVSTEDIPVSATGFSPPLSPTRHNFSYPQRAPPNSMNSYQAANEKIPVENDPTRTTNQPVGTLANLKTAAAGLHGVGETLRGTLNSSIDRKFGHASPETLAHNEQTLAAGRSEIESGKFHDSVKEREKAHTVGKVLRKPVNQQGQEESGNLRVVNQKRRSRKDGQPDKRVGTGEFAYGKVDPVEAAHKAGGQTSHSTGDSSGGSTKDSGGDSTGDSSAGAGGDSTGDSTSESPSSRGYRPLYRDGLRKDGEPDRRVKGN